MKALKNVVAVAAAVVLGTLLTACGTTVVTNGEKTNVITVSASSETKIAPDKASFQVSVYAQGDTAEVAQKQGAELTNAVIAALKEAGVEEKDIQTTYTNVSPTYDWSSNEPAITGYESNTSLSVSGADIGAGSGLMEVCISAGATGVDGPRYYVSAYDEAYQQALADAVTATKPKAEAMATAAGVALGPVISIDEGYQDTGYRYATNEEAKALATGAAADGGEVMEIAPGEVTIEAQVTVSYAIN